MKCLFLFWRGYIFTVELEAVQMVSLSCMAVLISFIEFYPLTKILVTITIKKCKRIGVEVGLTIHILVENNCTCLMECLIYVILCFRHT